MRPGVVRVRVGRVEIQAEAVLGAGLRTQDGAELHLLQLRLQFALQTLRVLPAGDGFQVNNIGHGRMIVIQILTVGGFLQVQVDLPFRFAERAVVIDAVPVSVHRIDEEALVFQALHQPAA